MVGATAKASMLKKEASYLRYPRWSFVSVKRTLFHMGDTLVFRLRGAEFEQLTRDHVTDIGGYRYPSRALGMDGSVDIDYTHLPLKQGDFFVFTTEGVRGTLMPSDYVRLIRQNASDLDVACECLASEAKQRAQDRGYGR